MLVMTGTTGAGPVKQLFDGLEPCQHEPYPLTDASARSQFRALYLRQSSARVGHALAKASVKRLLASYPIHFARPSSSMPSLLSSTFSSPS